MQATLTIDERKHFELFESIAQMVRGFAELAAAGDPTAHEALDRSMRAGSVVRITISVGSAGPLGTLFQAVHPDGTTSDLVIIDAPPSAKPFCFAP